MADITIVNTPRTATAAIETAQQSAPQEAVPGPVPKPAAEPAEPYFDLIELLFFAYRDFVGDPDEVLEKLGFGRAHHRVLHFVNRNPGMKAAANDRRQRLLYATAAGEALATKLAGLQAVRIKRVLAELGPDTRETARRFLAGMIDPQDRERVLLLISRADSFSGGVNGNGNGQSSSPNGMPQNSAPQDKMS